LSFALQVLAMRGQRKVYMPNWSVGRHITLLAAVNLEGDGHVPTIIYEGKNKQKAWFEEAKHLNYAMDSAGYANETIFYEWVVNWLEATEPEGGCADNPRVLFLDQYYSHLCIPTLKLLRACNVIVIAMQPHTTHLFCVLDTSVFGLVKRYLKQYFKDTRLVITVNNISKYISLAWEKALLPQVDEATGRRTSAVAKAAAAAGFEPFSRDVMKSSIVKVAEEFKAKARAAKAAAGAGDVPEAASVRITLAEREALLADFVKMSLQAKDNRDKGFNPLKAARAKQFSEIVSGAAFIQAEEDKVAAAALAENEKVERMRVKEAKSEAKKKEKAAKKAEREAKTAAKAASMAEAKAAAEEAKKAAAAAAAAKAAEKEAPAGAAGKKRKPPKLEDAVSAADGAYRPAKRVRHA
jgi:hypothetical protein